MEILPAILAKSVQDFEQKINAPLMQIAPFVHIDVMDNSFTAYRCISHPGLIPHTFKPQIELHLMVNDPMSYLEEWVAHPAFTRATIHIESPCDHTRILLFNKSHGKETSFALSPQTDPQILSPFINDIKRILVMGVSPGQSGQSFLGEEVLAKIKHIRHLYPHHHIEVDGGITHTTVQQVQQSGAHSACASSAIWNTTTDPITAYKRLTYL